MAKLPLLSGREMIQILERNGFEVVRQKGSHVSLRKITEDKVWKTVVPLHDTLARGTLMEILRQTGLSKEELF